MRKKRKLILIGKYFYIMKVIYINTIIEVVYKRITNVQQHLNMGKPKYILNILKNW